MKTRKDYRFRHDNKYRLFAIISFLLGLAFLIEGIVWMIHMGIQGNFSYYPECVEQLLFFLFLVWLSGGSFFSYFSIDDNTVTIKNLNGFVSKFDIRDDNLSFYLSFHYDFGFSHGIVLEIEDKKKKRIYTHFFAAEATQTERIRQVFTDYILPMRKAHEFRMDDSLTKQLNLIFNTEERTEYGIEKYVSGNNQSESHKTAAQLRKKKIRDVIFTVAIIAVLFLVIFTIFGVLTHLAETGQIPISYEDNTPKNMKIYIMASFFTVFIALPIIVGIIMSNKYAHLPDKDILDLSRHQISVLSWHHEQH